VGDDAQDTATRFIPFNVKGNNGMNLGWVIGRQRGHSGCVGLAALA